MRSPARGGMRPMEGVDVGEGNLERVDDFLDDKLEFKDLFSTPGTFNRTHKVKVTESNEAHSYFHPRIDVSK